jgi:Flp pilus assembly protein TadG
MALCGQTTKTRKTSGISAIEVGCGLVFLLVLTLIAIDITILLLGYEFNDRACRDACKAASQQSSSDAAQAAAAETLKVHKADGNYVTDPILLIGAGEFKYQSFAATTGNPTVTVTTECKVKTPVPLTFVGDLFSEHLTGRDDSWTFRKRYTLPIATYNAQVP